MTVVEPGEETTSHTFKQTELAAVARTVAGTNLRPIDSVSWYNQANDITYRIGITAEGRWLFEAEGAGAAGGGTYTLSICLLYTSPSPRD